MAKAKSKTEKSPSGRELSRGEKHLKRIYTGLARQTVEKFKLSELPGRWDELKAFQKAQIESELVKLNHDELVEIATGLCARDARECTKQALQETRIERLVGSLAASLGVKPGNVHVVKCGG